MFGVVIIANLAKKVCNSVFPLTERQVIRLQFERRFFLFVIAITHYQVDEIESEKTVHFEQIKT